MMKQLSSRILYKVFFWVAPITIGALCISLYISNYFMESIIRTYVPDLNIRTAENASLKVSEFINTAKLLLENASDVIAHENSQMRKNNHLINIQLKNPFFSNLYAVDKHGTEIANINLSDEYTMHMLARHKMNALHGKVGYSDIYFSKEDIPYMEICVPVEKWRRVTAALCGELDFMSVWMTLDKIKIGKTGKVILISENGTVLSHPDRRMVINKTTLKIPDADDGSFSKTEDERTKLVTYSIVRHLGWKAIVEQDSDEVFGAYRKMIRYAIILIISVIILTFACLALFSYKITKPIRHLTEETKIFASGNLDHKTSIKSNDEIGQLSEAINSMIGEIKKGRQMLIQAEKLSSIGTFASSIAHELKNPITALSSYAYLIKENPNQSELLEYSSEIIEELQRIDKILERLMQLSRQGEYKFENINVNDVIQKSAKILEHHFLRFKNTNIQVALHPNMPEIQADKNLLQQVIINLLLNACDAISEKGRVNISTNYSGESVFIEVSDDGQGISENDIDKIFNPFFTTKSSGSNTGLGLYITNEIIRLHDGSIHVESVQGKSTSFSITLNA